MVFKRIRIMTDSVADIPEDLLKKWNIGVVPTYVHYDGKSEADDGKELDRAEFFRRLPQMSEFPTTAAPAPALAEQILLQAIEGYDHIVSVNIPEKLSATINNVRLGAKAKALAGKVTVLDSGTLTMGLGMQVLIAAEIAAQTGDVNQVVAAVEKVRHNQKLYAIIAELEYLRRSGRVNGVIAFLGSLLQIKPILDVHDGEVDVAERARTFKKATARLKELIEAQSPLDRLVILQIDNEAGAKELIASLGDTAPADTMIISVGPTLGVHIGPGSLGAITLSKSWRN